MYSYIRKNHHFYIQYFTANILRILYEHEGRFSVKSVGFVCNVRFNETNIEFAQLSVL